MTYCAGFLVKHVPPSTVERQSSVVQAASQQQQQQTQARRRRAEEDLGSRRVLLQRENGVVPPRDDSQPTDLHPRQRSSLVRHQVSSVTSTVRPTHEIFLSFGELAVLPPTWHEVSPLISKRCSHPISGLLS